MKSSRTLNIIQKIVILLIIIIISGNIGYKLGQKNISSPKNLNQFLINAKTPVNQDVDFALFWQIWDKLKQKYLDKTKIDAQKMMYGAISGMVASLGDPYTIFLPPKDNSDFKSDLAGSFEGIGAQLGIKNDKIVVIAPLKDLPAEKMGIKAGDWIAQVNDEDTIGWTVPQAVNKIRGPKGTQVKLTIIHENSNTPITLKVTRDTILVKSVELTMKKIPENCASNCKQVGYIKLSRFGDQTNDEWSKVIGELNSEMKTAGNFKGVILDLRNNPGGYFQSAIYTASEFIKSGVIVIQENSDSTRETFSVNRLGNLLDVPLVVLINKGSASAAEIVAGALRDQNRGKLVGETTFGKGSVQTPEDLSDGSGLHITTARWIMPKGEWINGKGIKPDIEIKDATDSADLQLNKALEMFN